MEKLEEFIYGNGLNEEQFFQSILAEKGRMDVERMLNRVQAIQGELNARLRQGVEENYPRLLEQVTAIERLDSAHSHFQQKMDIIAKKAELLAKQMDQKAKYMKIDNLAISNLTKMKRLLGDFLRCENSMTQWREEKDLFKRAEIIIELNMIVKNNDKLKQLKWLQECCIFKREEMISIIQRELLEKLRFSLQSLDSNMVNTILKSLQKLLDGAYQKEINLLTDEAVQELDSLFLQFSAQSDKEKVKKLLPQLGKKLHSLLEQFQLLGPENSLPFVRQLGKIIATRIPPDFPYAMRFVQTIYKCLLTHNDTISNIIRDALKAIWASVLNQSLCTLFTLIDENLQLDECRHAIIVEKLNGAFRSELASVDWDNLLLNEMKANIGKALQYVAVKLEQKLQFGDTTLRFIGRISKAQTHNYELLNIAHDLSCHWPSFSGPLSTLLHSSLKTIIDQMRATVSLVLNSMHDENMQAPLTGTTSEYIKELCAHLKVFRQHCCLIKPMNDSMEELPSFLNGCIEQFLLNISLIRPLNENSINRYVRDLDYLCKNGLQIFNCKYAKMLHLNQQIQEFLQSITYKCDQFQQLIVSDQLGQQSNIISTLLVPQWFIAHLIICAANEELYLPHDSVGWSRFDYVKWFTENSEIEHWRFLRGLLDSYKQSVIEKGGTEFVRQFPVLNQLVNSNIYKAV